MVLVCFSCDSGCQILLLYLYIQLHKK